MHRGTYSTQDSVNVQSNTHHTGCAQLQCVAACCHVLQGAAVCCSVLLCVAVCCSVLWCAALTYKTLRLRTAAQLGHGIAQSALAYMYHEGTGVPQDRERAAVLRKDAAKWEQRRVTNYFFNAAQGSGGTLAVERASLLPFVGYLRTRVEELRQQEASLVLARRLLTHTLAHSYRARQYTLLMATLESPQEWLNARQQTLQLEQALQSMYGPVCTAIGQDPCNLTYQDTCAVLQDLLDIEAIALRAGPSGELEVRYTLHHAILIMIFFDGYCRAIQCYSIHQKKRA